MSDTKREANVSEIETLDITEAEERAGLRRVFDLVGELPIPPDKTRKLAGYIARIEAQVATLTQERDEARAAAQAMSKAVSRWWFEEARPIINAIGEISVQEAMDFIERELAARVRDSKTEEAGDGKNGR
jgi:hypothetical protein